MSDESLKGLEIISQAAGARPDFTQGGGGNTSAKLGNEYMAIKASGYKLSQVTAGDGYVIVNYKNIIDYYNSVDVNADIDFEKDSAQMVKENIVKEKNPKGLRPSIEAGFHSILDKYVIHTHSVYANILCCVENGIDLVKNIFSTGEYDWLWIPYVLPGFSLTLEIQKKAIEYYEKNGKRPNIIFMENHGLIVTAHNAQECVSLNEKVNNKIREYIGINEPYPQIIINGIDSSTFMSGTKYLNQFFKGNDNIDNDYFTSILYPDQVIYLNPDSIAINSSSNKVNINTHTGEIMYRCGQGEARTIDETLTAYIYIREHMEKHNLKMQPMTPEKVSTITGLEAESYRKKILNTMK